MRPVVYLISALLVTAIVWQILRPRPVAVDVAEVTRGYMQLTVHDDGRTRIREKYIVSTPVAGRLVRIDLKPGARVVADSTLLAVIEPGDPTLLDPRALAEARAREQSAESRLSQLAPRLKLMQDRLNFVETELSRVRQLKQQNAATQQMLDQSVLEFDVAKAEYADVVFARSIAEYELKLARAALIHTGEQPADVQPSAFRFPILSPITGAVLRVFQESASVVAAGAPLLELGDPSDLEVEVDVLSTDAVRIEPGAPVLLEQWGGENPIPGKVRLVEPSAFTRISALGIEEQRVNVIIDFEREKAPAVLGDGYRVDARIVVWEGADVLKIPVGALFRQGSDWAVFRNVNQRAQTTILRIGHRNDREAEVLEGLKEGDQVVVHPGDLLHEGSQLQPRSQ